MPGRGFYRFGRLLLVLDEDFISVGVGVVIILLFFLLADQALQLLQLSLLLMLLLNHWYLANPLRLFILLGPNTALFIKATLQRVLGPLFLLRSHDLLLDFMVDPIVQVGVVVQLVLPVNVLDARGESHAAFALHHGAHCRVYKGT